MAEDWTCGKGLAANAWLPAKLGDVSAAMAEMLDIHTTALDLTDENSAREREAYFSLVGTYRAVAAQLHALAEEMIGYRDLPMGRHEMAVMTDPKMAETFAELVRAKEDLLTTLQQRIDEDKSMLAEMRAAGGPRLSP
jgi:hypothetical protein